MSCPTVQFENAVLIVPAHLPFERTFSSKYPEWLSKDDLAEGYRDWVAKHGIVSPLSFTRYGSRLMRIIKNVWRKTTALSGSWDSTKTQWSLKILREGEERLITSSFIVMAGGAGGQMPKMPEYANRVSTLQPNSRFSRPFVYSHVMLTPDYFRSCSEAL